VTVIAAVRNPNSDMSNSLTTLPKGNHSHLIIVKIDSSSETDASDAVKHLQTHEGISHLDVVIANAGIHPPPTPMSAVSFTELKETFMVNTFAPLLLFQATLPLLSQENSTSNNKKPIFTTMASAMGSVGGMEQRPYPSGPYGPSKAALNWVTRKIHFENEKIVAFALDPG
jgi:norsolorinic acid ketoreductase